ncbi:NADP-dependent oxidoreductase domain-containing protein [Ochromonadaceae sp. CCMP2298]|nr:NADP-dependent oxidoreductase domain-containing protein [Ochromonadaceae sp. CCMP2298]
MSNRVPVPQMGLGTGGIFLEQAMEVFSNALSLGYRMFDLAREYGNEHVIKELLNNGLAKRGEIFLATKVWPTELGFEPTSKAITTSLREMGTTYIDLYMLHWPRCDPSIEWMHCQDTVEVHGTWRESWRALEKAYAEGRVMGIGVSNFDRALLEELRAQSVVLPHAVQNHAEPGSVDKDVRSWCEAFGILYQPYAPLRNLQFLPEHVKRALKAVAKKHAVSIHQAALRLFIQSGAQVIPRSSSVDHQLENLGAFSWALEEAELRALGWETSVELEVKA